MLKIFKKFAISVSLLGLLFAPLAMVGVASAQDGGGDAASAETAGDCGGVQTCLDAGACLNTTQGDCDGDTGGDVGERVQNIIRLVINIFSLLVGVIAVIMIIVGGLKYITSSGDSGNVTGAKNTILYAIVGLVVVALAQVVVRFVLSKVTNTASA